MPPSVRKFPVSLGRGRGHHVVPLLRDATWQLVRLDNRKPAPRAFLAYLGQNITTADVIDAMRAGKLISDDEPDPTDIIDAYLNMIPEFVIGNVIAIEPAPDFPGFRLVKLFKTPSAAERAEA